MDKLTDFYRGEVQSSAVIASQDASSISGTTMCGDAVIVAISKESAGAKIGISGTKKKKRQMPRSLGRANQREAAEQPSSHRRDAGIWVTGHSKPADPARPVTGRGLEE